MLSYIYMETTPNNSLQELVEYLTCELNRHTMYFNSILTSDLEILKHNSVLAANIIKLMLDQRRIQLVSAKMYTYRINDNSKYRTAVGIDGQEDSIIKAKTGDKICLRISHNDKKFKPYGRNIRSAILEIDNDHNVRVTDINPFEDASADIDWQMVIYDFMPGLHLNSVNKIELALSTEYHGYGGLISDALMYAYATDQVEQNEFSTPLNIISWLATQLIDFQDKLLSGATE